MGMSTLEMDRDWKRLLSFLPSDYRELAHEHKQLQVQYGNARFTTADELLRAVLLHVGADMPLRQTAALLAESGGPVVSPNRIHMKMRKVARYLQALVARMAPWTVECAPERWGGYELVAVDASAFAGRCANGTDARIHAAIRLADLSIYSAHATDVSGGESLRRFSWLVGQLVIADRGYSNAAGIEHVVSQGADVLVRVNRGALPLYSRTNKAFAIEPFLRRIQEGQVVERKVRIRLHTDSRRCERIVDGRLIATRLPADKADEARRRLRSEIGSSVTAEALEMAAYVALFTTAPTARLAADQCLATYRLRWQIELLFKRWKSLCHFDRLPNERSDTILSWLYGKLLLGLILDRIASEVPTLSPPVRTATQRRTRKEARSTHAFSDVV